MKYFCPMCLSRFEWDVIGDKYTKRHSHDMIAFAVDPNNEFLLDWVAKLQLPIAAQDEVRLRVAENVLGKTEAEISATLRDRRRLSDELKKAEDADERKRIQDEMAALSQREKELTEDLKTKKAAIAQLQKSIEEAQPRGLELLKILIEKSGLGKISSGLLVGVPVVYNDSYKILITESDIFRALAYAYEVADNDSNKNKAELADLRAILDTLAITYGESKKVVKEITIPSAHVRRVTDPNNKPVWYRAGKYQKVCGVCRHPLYAHAGQNPEIVIGLLGSERVGKSSVIAATIHAGQQASGLWTNRNDNWYWKFPVEGDDAQWEAIKRDLLVPYEKGRAVLKTREGLASHQFCVSLEMHVPKQERMLTVTFVDLPGEYLNTNISMLRSDCKGLFDNADVYWFCLDIVQLQANNNLEFMMRHGYDVSVERTDGSTKTAAEIEEECDQHIIHPDRFGGLQAIKDELNNFKGRAAIILTKSDDFENTPVLFNPDQAIGKADAPIYDVSSAEDGLGLWETKFVKHSRKVLEAAFLNYSASASAWPESLQEIFPDHAFFSFSAYGFTPLKKGSLDTKVPIKPYRTRWPMLWTLAILGYLDVKIVVRRSKGKKDIDEVQCVKARLTGDALERKAYESLCGKFGWAAKRYTELPKSKHGRWG